MTTTTIITTRNGQPSTEGNIRQYSDGSYSAAIISIYNDERDVLQAKNCKTLAGAQRYLEQYRAKMRESYKRGELVEGVQVL